jgi:hypothetical protein
LNDALTHTIAPIVSYLPDMFLRSYHFSVVISSRCIQSMLIYLEAF